MANINTELEQIRKAVYGREVRGSIANAIELINKEQISTSTAQTNLDSKFEQLIINAGNSNAEVVAARIKADGTKFATLGKRLDKGDELHNTLNNEVVGARTDSKNIVHKNLKARLDNFDSNLDTKASEVALVVERRRIDNIVAQPPTKDNVETVDIRVGANGETYTSAGESVRSQYKDILDIITTGNKRTHTKWAEGFVNNKGITTPHRQMITSVDFIELDESGINIDIEDGYQYTVHYETKDGNLKLGNAWFSGKNHFTQYKDNTTTNRIRVTIYDSSFVGNMTIDYCNKIYLKQKKYKTINELENKITYFENKSFLNFLYKYIFKNCICIGDSLTRGYYTNIYPNGDGYYPTYPQFLEKITGWKCTNAGRSGATAKQWYDERIDLFNYKDKDVAIIYLGTNHGLEDTVDTDMAADTNGGAYCRIIERLQKDNSKMKIFLCTVSNVTYDTDGSKVVVTNNVIRKIAKKYNKCYCIELKDNNYYDLSKPVCHPHSDDVHLGSIGYNIQANVIAQSISDIVIGNMSEFEVILDEIH